MKKGIDTRFSNVKRSVPKSDWTSLTEVKRVALIKESIRDSFFDIEIINANKEGQVSILINNALSATERGTLLLDMEEFLKNNIDCGITIWHASIGDKSSLRNLRGIEVLS